MSLEAGGKWSRWPLHRAGFSVSPNGVVVASLEARWASKADRYPSLAASSAPLSRIRGQCFCQRSRSAIPAAIATTKTTTRGDSVARFANAGPGHKPTIPQPIPNKADPITKERSILILVGQTLCVARTGRSLRFANQKPGTEMTNAAIMTTARLGSQVPKMSRKANTFAGCIIPEISRPQPKINPQKNAAMINMA